MSSLHIDGTNVDVTLLQKHLHTSHVPQLHGQVESCMGSTVGGASDHMTCYDIVNQATQTLIL